MTKPRQRMIETDLRKIDATEHRAGKLARRSDRGVRDEVSGESANDLYLLAALPALRQMYGSRPARSGSDPRICEALDFIWCEMLQLYSLC